MLTLEELRGDPSIDTVIMAFTDMQGRLLGKRLHRDFFFEKVEHGHGTEGCNYLLALDMEMEPTPGYELASWERGYGDFDLAPDLATLRRIPWLEATALVLCDVAWTDGSPVRPSPRQVLRAQVERARALGFEVMVGSELEFYLLRETYEEAHRKGYDDLTPSVPYILDYHILATTYDEPLLRQIRNGMQGAGIRVETSKGEAWPGQQEINFRYDDALTMADNHVVYKNGAKEIAHLNGCSITFMAKPHHTWIGSSCHIHSSLWQNGKSAFTGESEHVQAVPRRTDRVRAGARGLLRAERELVQAVRLGLVGADDARLGPRQPHLRLPHRRLRLGDARRVAHPGRRREPVSRVRRDDRCRAARDRERPRAAGGARGERVRVAMPSAFPRRFARRSRRSKMGSMARAALGDDVVDHYLNYARTEQQLFDKVVTDWERERLYERG